MFVQKIFASSFAKNLAKFGAKLGKCLLHKPYHPKKSLHFFQYLEQASLVPLKTDVLYLFSLKILSGPFCEKLHFFNHIFQKIIRFLQYLVQASLVLIRKDYLYLFAQENFFSLICKILGQNEGSFPFVSHIIRFLQHFVQASLVLIREDCFTFLSRKFILPSYLQEIWEKWGKFSLCQTYPLKTIIRLLQYLAQLLLILRVPYPEHFVWKIIRSP